MATPIGRIGFAAGVLGTVGLLAALIAGREWMTPQMAGGAPAAVGSRGQSVPGGAGMATPVVVVSVGVHRFSDGIQAIGSVQAYESVTITSSVTDTIAALRFDSGQRVRRGAVLVELAAAEESAGLSEAQASLAEAERELARFQALQERGFVPLARLEAAQAGYDQAAARVETAQARLADRVIRAPFSGVIGLRQVSPGALVRPGDVIVTLDDLSRVKIDFDVSETDIAALTPGVAILAAAAGQSLEGSIESVDSRVNIQTRTVRVRAVLPNPEGILRTGMTVTVTIQSNPREALAVPEIAVLDRPEGALVLRVAQGEQGTVAEAAPVRIGRRADGMAEILEGLAEGDAVVVEGINRVRPGQPVRLPGAEAAGAVPARS